MMCGSLGSLACTFALGFAIASLVHDPAWPYVAAILLAAFGLLLPRLVTR